MSYPALKNLGINRPHEISSFSLYSNDEVDTLRIKYTRQKGSLLPVVKKFHFPRRPLPGVQIVPGKAVMTEISPALEDALAELTQLLDKERAGKSKKEEIIHELSEFEAYVKDRIAEFKAEIEKF